MAFSIKPEQLGARLENDEQVFQLTQGIKGDISDIHPLYFSGFYDIITKLSA